MAVRQIYIWPDPVLSTVTKPVEQVDHNIRALIADMFDTIYAENGIGLAANQIGVSLRVLIIDLDPKRQAADNPDIQAELKEWLYEGPIALINPKIVQATGSIVWEEGCLSVPGITDHVTRNESIVVEALDKNGEPSRIECRGLFAVAIQHELDHLNGIAFVQHLSRLKRDVIKGKMLRLKQTQQSSAKVTSR